jgi:hypothetical protein
LRHFDDFDGDDERDGNHGIEQHHVGAPDEEGISAYGIGGKNYVRTVVSFVVCEEDSV